MVTNSLYIYFVHFFVSWKVCVCVNEHWVLRTACVLSLYTSRTLWLTRGQCGSAWVWKRLKPLTTGPRWPPKLSGHGQSQNNLGLCWSISRAKAGNPNRVTVILPYIVYILYSVLTSCDTTGLLRKHQFVTHTIHTHLNFQSEMTVLITLHITMWVIQAFSTSVRSFFHISLFKIVATPYSETIFQNLPVYMRNWDNLLIAPNDWTLLSDIISLQYMSSSEVSLHIQVYYIIQYHV